MKANIVLAHPESRSFNAQLATCARTAFADTGYEASVRDLYRNGFDPLEGPAHFRSRRNPGRFDPQAEQRHASDTNTLSADALAELTAVEEADLLVLQYPMWWYTPPAMLKGWLDRVFVYGRAYTSRRRYDAGFFAGKKAMLSVTTGALEETFAPDGRNANIDLVLWPLNFTLSYLGFTVLKPSVCFGVEGGLKYSDGGEAVERLQNYMARFDQDMRAIADRPSIPFNGWSDWTASGQLTPEARSYSAFMTQHPWVPES